MKSRILVSSKRIARKAHTRVTTTVTAHKNKGENAFRGSGNYSSDEAKEIARLKRELRDTQDALEVLLLQKSTKQSYSLKRFGTKWLVKRLQWKRSSLLMRGFRAGRRSLGLPPLSGRR